MAHLTTANRGLGQKVSGSTVTMGTTGTEGHLLGGHAGAPLSSVNHARDGVPQDDWWNPSFLGRDKWTGALSGSLKSLWDSTVYPDV